MRWRLGAGAWALVAAMLSGMGWAHAGPSFIEAAPAGWVYWNPPGDLLTRRAWWSPVDTLGHRPAVLMLHGCGGMLDARGHPSERTRRYAEKLNAQGWHVLAMDSLTPRGETSLCTQRIGSRRVTQTERRQDAWAALRWLAAQPGVDADRMALLGWSNGGSAVLAATNLHHPEVQALRAAPNAPPAPRLAVAFYPGCEADLKRGYQPLSPLVLMLGLADDWTPAQPCLDLAKGTANVTVHAWPGAYHGFDGPDPVRLRTDVPNGVHPDQGVHVGADPVASEESARRLVEHLQRAFR
jgi:dienelactone hydrolase